MYLLVPNSMIFKTYQNLTQIWGIQVSGQYSRVGFVIDHNEQYLYTMAVKSSGVLELVLIH